jgi:hypothetical protein
VRISVTSAVTAVVVAVGGSLVGASPAVAAPSGGGTAEVAAHWTPERLAHAQPRDLQIDGRGLGYLRGSDGGLAPYGHGVGAAVPAPTVDPSGAPRPGSPVPQGKPSGGKDVTGPTVSGMEPAGGTVGADATFSATVEDPSGVRSVAVVITAPDGGSSSFPATADGSTWSVPLTGLTAGSWSWHVVATDATRARNATESSAVAFTVDTSADQPGGGTGSGATAKAEWSTGGAVQTAAGRLYFEMPDHRNLRTWSGYVCSGTVVGDEAGDRSVILTAAHCVFDDVNKTFARNVLFIPNQAGGGSPTDTDCTNDPIGCWAPAFGVVDQDWTTRSFPDNVAWDYAYYVVPGTAAHRGTPASSDSLEDAAGTLPVQFDAPAADRTHALGYSFRDDPRFMYCAEEMTTRGPDNWWLPNCGLSGGASGGPWVQPMDTGSGTGPIVSVNSWGYLDQPGMAGPKLSDSSASLLFAEAQRATVTTGGGIVVP